MEGRFATSEGRDCGQSLFEVLGASMSSCWGLLSHLLSSPFNPPKSTAAFRMEGLHNANIPQNGNVIRRMTIAPYLDTSRLLIFSPIAIVTIATKKTKKYPPIVTPIMILSRVGIVPELLE